MFEKIDVSAHREAILPGETNEGGFDGFVEDTKFSVDRGIFRSSADAFDVEITSATPEATIVYTIAIHFSEDVTVSLNDLTVQGVNVAEYRFADFQYDTASFTAVWTLAQTPAADKLRLALGGGSTDATGRRRLDGNWQDAVSLFPSGNGLIEANDVFRFRIDLLPGDVDGNGEVSRGDLKAVLGGLGSAVGEVRYDARQDVDANGRVEVDDLRAVLRRIGTRRPAGEPGSGAAPPIVATDAVFGRLGRGAGNNLVASIVDVDVNEMTGSAEIPRIVLSSGDEVGRSCSA